MPVSRCGTASRSSSMPTPPLPAISTDEEVRPAAPMSWIAATAPVPISSSVASLSSFSANKPDADAALPSHPHRRGGEAGRPHVLDRGDGAGAHQLQRRLDQQLLGERIADLHRGPLPLGGPAAP